MIRQRFDAEFYFWFNEKYILTIFMHSCTEIDAKITEIGAKILKKKLVFFIFQKMQKVKKSKKRKGDAK